MEARFRSRLFPRREVEEKIEKEDEGDKEKNYGDSYESQQQPISQAMNVWLQMKRRKNIILLSVRSVLGIDSITHISFLARVIACQGLSN